MWPVATVLHVVLTWLGLPCAAPTCPLLGSLRPVLFGVSVIVGGLRDCWGHFFCPVCVFDSLACVPKPAVRLIEPVQDQRCQQENLCHLVNAL